MSRRFTFKFRAVTVILALAALTIAAAATSHAGAEGDVFARLIAKATSVESMTVGRYILRNSKELRAVSRDILGAESSRFANEELAEKAIRRLKKTRDVKTATILERRLLAAEEDFTLRLTRDPKADLESVLADVSTERFQRKVFAEGKTVPASGKVLGGAEAALSEALQGTLGTKAAATKLNAKLTRAYEAAIRKHSTLERYLPKALVYERLSDAEMTDYSDQLAKLLAELAAAPASKTLEQNLKVALRKTLRDQVPASTIESRADALIAASGQREPFLRALGDMTLAETNELYFGFQTGSATLKPSPDSLLGRYLKETGATTLVRAFENAAAREAGKRGAMGPKRLVVSVSEESLSTFLKYFGRKEWMSVFNHAYMVHEGQVITYSRESSSMRIPGTEYTPFPMLQLKSTEAQRLRQYFKLFTSEKATEGFDSMGSAPWMIEGYCAKSAWAGGCTQHIGNIPIGDTRVVEYTVPGPQLSAELNPAPLTQMLQPYSSRNALLKRVWKIPGNQMLGETIGQQAAYLRGELANPGWTIWTLMGSTSAERVPVVFVSRANHRAKIDPNFEPQIEGRN